MKTTPSFVLLFALLIAPLAQATTTYRGSYLDFEKAEATSLCLEVDDQIEDRFKGDAEMEGHGYLFQNVPIFQDGQSQCSSQLEHNGNSVSGCTGKTLRFASSLSTLKDLGKAHGEVVQFVRQTEFAKAKVVLVGAFVLKVSQTPCAPLPR